MKKLKKYIKPLLFIGIVFTVILTSTFSALALSWNGSTVGSVGASNAQNSKGYTIRLMGSDGCFGYRFSIVDKDGNTKQKSGYPSAIDVFRKVSLDSFTNKVYNNYYSASTKYNKKQLITNRSKVNLSMSKISSQSNSFTADSMGFETTLPAPESIGTWQSRAGNINKVLNKLGAGNSSSSKERQLTKN